MTPTLFALADGPVTQNLSIFAPASPPAEAIRQLFALVGAITGGIFLLVEAVLIYSLIKARRRTAGDVSEPPQVYGSKPIEIAWTAAPTLVVFVLLLVVARTEWEVRPGPDQKPPEGSKPLYVTVVGRQWWWELRYTDFDGKPLGGFPTANELHVPASADGTARPVYLRLESADVCHSFWVPRLAGKTDLIPGRVNQMWFQANEPGLFLGQCAEYCGTQHAGMLLRVVAEPEADFLKWVENERKPAVDDPAGKAGREAFLKESCVNCHAIRGTPAVGTYAPDLTHLAGRQTLASGMVPNTRENLKAWIADPQKVKNGCLMPAFGLAERELDEVVKYLGTLR
jgi:cytochrome c oxidase subunit 2